MKPQSVNLPDLNPYIDIKFCYDHRKLHVYDGEQIESAESYLHYTSVLGNQSYSLFLRYLKAGNRL